MHYTFSLEVQRQLKEINKKDQKLSKKIYKQLILFLNNPKHPSLRTHKLLGRMKNQYSISISQGFRMTYILSGEKAHFTKIGTHDEVYKSN